MIVKGTCPRCGGDLELEADPLPPEDCGGRAGFYCIDTECPHCGLEIETVISEIVKGDDVAATEEEE